MKLFAHLLAAAWTTTVALSPAPARAESLGPASPTFHADVETDPTAFVLGGYSLHAGLGWDRLRVDLGAYAMDLPEFVHGNEDFEVSFHGYGAKLQYFLFEPQSGGFVGIDGGVTHTLVRLKHSELAEEDTQFALGVNAGWRFDLPAEFYVTPWLGVSYAAGAAETELGGERFEQSSVFLFPAVHLGYHLR